MYQTSQVNIELIDRTNLKCRRCGKSCKLKKKRELGWAVVGKFFEDARDAADYVKVANEY